ncbi:hypothetical protein [Nocardia sp. 348MFTsu5.1]|uniref:hypothetical protein n=1 Tax=Nocardia sp. 348MFTsu5.1 TaxID=1172185 RepID=UPI0012DF7CE7|nr:hypothetical protein [Nocardia sp. 348MFTsu5.1]
MEVVDGKYGPVAAVCVESATDAFDLELVDDSKQVLAAQQIKTRQLSDTWPPSEIVAMLNAFGTSDCGSQTHFEIVLGGRLGPSGEALRDTLQKARTLDDPGAFATKASDKLTASAAAIAPRTRLIVDPTPTSMLLSSAKKHVVAHLGVPGFDAVNEADNIVQRLYMLITDRAGQPRPDDRLVHLDEIRATFHGAFVIAAGRWDIDTKASYVDAIVARPESQAVRTDLRPLRTPIEHAAGVEVSQVELSALFPRENPRISLVSGQSGSGKSTLTDSVRRHGAAATSTVVVVVDAQRFVPGRFWALISDAVAATLERPASMQLILGFLGDADSLLVLDSVSEIPEGSLTELAAEIRAVVSAQAHCQIALFGRDPAVLNSVVPAGVDRSAYHLVGVLPDGQRELVTRVLADAGSTNGEDRVFTVIQRIRYALGSASSVPYLLTMAAELVARGFDIKGRAQMYTIFTEEMARVTGVVNLQVSLLGLGIVFSELLGRGARQCDQFDWNVLLKAAAAQLGDSGIPTSAEQLRQVALRGGFVAYEDYNQTVRPAHDSLADFVSAMAMAKGIVSPPTRIASNDYLRLRFLAEISGVTDEIASLICRDLPLVVAEFAEHDRGTLSDKSPAIATEFCGALMPEVIDGDVGVKIATDSARSLATLGHSPAAYIPIAELVEASNGSGVREFRGGAFAAAERLWQSYLSSSLAATGYPSKIPDTAEKAAEALRVHDNETRAHVTRIANDLVRIDLRQSLIDSAMPEPATIKIRATMSQSSPYWPTVYLRSTSTSVELCEHFDDDIDEDLKVGWSSVDAIVSKTPLDTARGLIRNALNELANYPWL